MEPPSCTELLRLVRTTAAVVTEVLAPAVEAGLLLPLMDDQATPAATAPPTRAPAMAAMATTRLVEKSAIGVPRSWVRGRAAVAAGLTPEPARAGVDIDRPG